MASAGEDTEEQSVDSTDRWTYDDTVKFIEAWELEPCHNAAELKLEQPVVHPCNASGKSTRVTWPYFSMMAFLYGDGSAGPSIDSLDDTANMNIFETQEHEFEHAENIVDVEEIPPQSETPSTSKSRKRKNAADDQVLTALHSCQETLNNLNQQPVRQRESTIERATGDSVEASLKYIGQLKPSRLFKAVKHVNTLMSDLVEQVLETNSIAVVE